MYLLKNKKYSWKGKSKNVLKFRNRELNEKSLETRNFETILVSSVGLIDLDQLSTRQWLYYRKISNKQAPCNKWHQRRLRVLWLKRVQVIEKNRQAARLLDFTVISNHFDYLLYQSKIQEFGFFSKKIVLIILPFLK